MRDQKYGWAIYETSNPDFPEYLYTNDEETALANAANSGIEISYLGMWELKYFPEQNRLGHGDGIPLAIYADNDGRQFAVKKSGNEWTIAWNLSVAHAVRH